MTGTIVVSQTEHALTGSAHLIFDCGADGRFSRDNSMAGTLDGKGRSLRIAFDDGPCDSNATSGFTLSVTEIDEKQPRILTGAIEGCHVFNGHFQAILR
jgi:hypothetical protein